MTADDWKLIMGGAGTLAAAGFGLVKGTVLGAKWCLDRVREIVVDATVEIGKRVDGVREEVGGVKEEVGTMRGEMGVVHRRIDHVEGRVEKLEEFEVVEPAKAAKKVVKRSPAKAGRAAK